MITKEEYLNALNVIKEYKLQITDELKEIESLTCKKVDLSHYIPKIGMNNLSAYFSDVYGKPFDVIDLENIDIKLVREIDFKKLKRYRQIGAKTLRGLKELLHDHGSTS